MHLSNPISKHKNHTFYVIALMALAGLALFQDFIHAARNDYPFYLSEALLFNTFWLCFLPFFLWFESRLKPFKLNSLKQCVAVVILFTVMHTLLLSITIWVLSSILFQYSYGIPKVLSYTFSNDLVTLLIIYGLFVAIQRQRLIQAQKSHSAADCMVLNNAGKCIRIKRRDILYIQAATPYVSIHLAEQQHLQTTTLKSILEKLDERFIRIHKSSIININHVVACASRSNGDYDLLMSDDTVMRLSRNYAATFKQVFKSTQLKA